VSITPVTTDEIRAGLGIQVDSAGEVTLASCAELARRAVLRWGVASEPEIRSYLNRTLKGALLLTDVAKERARRAVAWLVTAREVDTARVEGAVRYLRALPCVVSCGDVGFVSGTVDRLPEEVSVEEVRDEEGETGSTRWVHLIEGDAPEALLREGFRLCTIEEWMGPPGFMEHARRRGGARLADLWPRLTSSHQGEADPVLDSGAVRVVAGAPGDFFGDRDADTPGARWRDAARAPDGLWLGARGGYAERFTNPVIVQIRDGRAVSAMDLFDWDEWSWALLSRGLINDAREQVRVIGVQLHQTCTLPTQLAAALEVMGRRERGWTWKIRSDAAEVAVAALISAGGLEAR
jgi:hypothetical protein